MDLKETEIPGGVEVLADYAAWQFPLKGEVIETKAYFARCESCDRPGCKGCIGCSGFSGNEEESGDNL